ncbi:hypothetical protein BH11PSE2_BH11PSE2_02770 [soil metagenome]
MPKRLTHDTRIDTLRKDTKRWLKAIRAAEPDAFARLAAAWPGAPAATGLRDIQHALALEYGQESWIVLKAELAGLATDQLSSDDRLDIVLRSAWDGGDRAAAARLLARDPSIATANLAAAAISGDLEEVHRRLAVEPEAVSQRLGSRDWPPLLYLAFGRLPGSAEQSVAIATALLDHGADPRAEFDDRWGNPFTVLTGVIGEGEGNRPPHPRAAELAELLIARGADPFDTQALYNTSIVGDDVTWLDRLFDHCERQGKAGLWQTVGRGLGGNVRQSTVNYLLGNAVNNRHPRRVAWLVGHGADPDGVNAYSGLAHHRVAQLQGNADIAELLIHLGARSVTLTGYEAFQSACLGGDYGAATALAFRQPAFVTAPGAFLTAAEKGNLEAVQFLLDLGASANAADDKGVRALHQAAGFGGAAVTRLLLERGAEIDPRETRFGATPLGWAMHMGRSDAVEVLTPISRDALSLTAISALDRLAAVLAETSQAAAAVPLRSGETPLFTLPDDPDEAVAAAEILLAGGCDPTIVNSHGLTAEMAARRRGLDEAADLIKGGLDE